MYDFLADEVTKTKELILATHKMPQHYCSLVVLFAFPAKETC